MLPLTLLGETYDELWAKYRDANNNGLPQTAIKELDTIFQKAVKENEQVHAIKAICKKIVAEGKIQGNKPEEKIIRFEKFIDTADKQIQPLLKVVLAKWYFHYYNRNSYRFINRSKTSADTNLSDFQTWDLPRLFAHIGKLYNSVLDNEEELSKVPISKFDGFLVRGNQPDDLCSNLFEFFAHDALSFYNHRDQSTANPQRAFEVDANSKVFDSLDEFLAWNPETNDVDSPNYKALKLYQRLLNLNKKSNNTNALVFNNIERVEWAKRVAVGLDKEERYLAALKRIAADFPDNQYTADAIAKVAAYYKSKEENIKAIDWAEKAVSKWPNSHGGLIASNIINDIKRPSISYNSEKTLCSSSNKIKINFKNLKHVYFRIVKRSDEEITDCRWGTPDSIYYKDNERLLSFAPYKTFDVSLDPGNEYKTQTKIVDLPKLEKGFYWLICSAEPDFRLDKNAIDYSALQITDLALISRTANSKSRNQFFVVDSVTGKPIEGAEVTLYHYNRKEECYRSFAFGNTDSNGSTEIDYTNSDILVLCKYKDDKMYNQVYLSNNRYYGSSNNETLYFFTDRAIYRPGQTVFFKAIAVSYNKEFNKYDVIKNKRITFDFKDTNRKPINSITEETNEYGSCTGSFIIPTDRLTGNYLIRSSLNNNSTTIKVEEYKRPKFHISIDPPTEGYQLGQKVSLKGHALSYTGAAIDNAEVKYRVTRRVNYPYWCWWLRPVSDAQEIVHGTIKTDEKGDFTINFEAQPDRSVNKDNDPVFTYSITADVTDSTGETRSGQQSVKVAYTALKLTIDANNNIDADKELDFSIKTTTHDGKEIPADGKVRIYALQQPNKPDRYNSVFSDLNSDNDAIRKMQEGKVVFEERFNTDDTGICKKQVKLPEGIYRIKVESEDRFGKEVKAQNNIVAVSYTSPKMTVKLPFIFRITSENLKPGDTFKAFWATGYDQGPAYIELCHKDEVLKSYWTDPNKNKDFITLPVTEDMRGGFFVKVFQVKENRYFEVFQPVNVDWSNKKLNLKLVHFNSKMEPGSKESWKVEVSGEDAEFKSIEMLASMYDASLDAFTKHYWPNIYPFYRDLNSIRNTFSNGLMKFSCIRNNLWKRGHYVDAVMLPTFPEYIVTDYYGYQYVGIKTLKAAPREAAPMLMNSKPDMVQAFSGSSVRAQEKELKSNEEIEPPSANQSVPNEKQEKEEEIDLSNVSARSNLNETAFFQPQLTVNENGVVYISFDMPEALTTWKFMAFAHGTKLQSGLLTQEAVTQKELMIQPNAPRFLREGDKIAFTVKVTNLSDKEQTGSVALELLDAVTDESRNAEFKNTENKKSFTVPAKQSKGFSWTLDVPYKPGFVKYKAVGATKTHSDGEEGLLPILSSRIMVTESLPLPINGPQTKNFKFEKLTKSGDSKTLEHKALTVEVTSNPAWYAIQALPYLIEFPHECSEQTFNRIYANKIAQHIANSDPKIRRVFDIWAKDELYNKGTALMSNLEKNQHLKSVTLMETPWVLDAKNENEQKHKIGVLFQKDRLEREINAATRKLRDMQYSDGSFPWFPGGPSSTYITQYIMTGIGRLKQLNIDADLLMGLKAADYMDKEMLRIYNEIIRHDPDYKTNIHLNSFIAYYLYGRSFFLKQREIPRKCEEAVNYFKEQAQKYWLNVPYRMSQAHIALGLKRFGDEKTPYAIVKSIKERSVTNEEMGRFWRDTERSYSWYSADIETQAMMIELFSEITKDEQAVEECKIWLLKQKQTQCWKTTIATADAIYSLILKGCDLLASDKLVKIYLDNKEVKPEKVEAGTGYYQKIYSGAEVKPQMGNIQLKKEDKGVAWGAVHWQYIEDMSKVTPFENNLKLKKSLFVKKNTEKGPVIFPVKDGKVRVGDLIVVRIELRSDRILEFVHMKDSRGSGMEPVNVISRYKWQDGLGYYESTKDTGSHFYIDRLPKGTFVFEYELRVQHAGQYQTGIAEIMCMYAPEFNSHSESFILNVEPLE